jgi:hypothetical protein
MPIHLENQQLNRINTFGNPFYVGVLYKITLTISIEMAQACTFWSLDYYYGFLKGFYIDFKHANAKLDIYIYVSLFRQEPSLG